MSMSEELQKRAADKPDPYTLAWWNQQYQEVHKGYRGATHAIHLALADNEDLGKQVRDLQGKVQALEAASELDRAKIGELQLRLDGQSELIGQIHARVDRQGEFLNQLKESKKEKAK